MGLEGSVLRNGRLHHSLDIGLVCYAPHLMCLFIVVATRIKISVLNILCKVFGMDANKQNSQMFQVYEMRFPGVQGDRKLFYYCWRVNIHRFKSASQGQVKFFLPQRG